MKLNKVLFIATVLIGGMLTSCNDDGYWNAASSEELGNASGSTYSFNSATSSFTFQPEDIVAGQDIQITVTRGNTQGAATVPVKVKFSDATLMSAPESVTFTDGSNTASLPIHFQKELTPGSKATAVLSLDTLSLGFAKVAEADPSLLEKKTAADSAKYKADAAAYDTYIKKLSVYKLATTITFTKDMRWDKVGKCVFVDYTFSDNGQAAENVIIEQGAGTNRYRLVKPYTTTTFFADENVTIVSDTGINFVLNDDNTIEFETNNGYVTTVKDSNGSSYIYAWVAKYVPKYCNVVSDGNIYQATMLGIIDGEGYYTGFSFAFQWTEGWPFAK